MSMHITYCMQWITEKYKPGGLHGTSSRSKRYRIWFCVLGFSKYFPREDLSLNARETVDRGTHITSISKSKLMRARILRRRSIVRSPFIISPKCAFPVEFAFWTAQFPCKTAFTSRSAFEIDTSIQPWKWKPVMYTFSGIRSPIPSYADQFLSLVSERSYECFIIV